MRAVNDGLDSSSKLQTGGFWHKFFGLDAPGPDRQEPGHDEPALGET